MKTVYVEMVGDEGIRYFTKRTVRSRRHKPMNIDRYICRGFTALCSAWLIVLSVATAAALCRIIMM